MLRLVNKVLFYIHSIYTMSDDSSSEYVFANEGQEVVSANDVQEVKGASTKQPVTVQDLISILLGIKTLKIGVSSETKNNTEDKIYITKEQLSKLVICD